MIAPEFKLDTSKLEAAIAVRLKYPGRTEAEAVNTSAFYIAVNTKDEMPAATVDRIDSDLDKFVVPQFRARGLVGPTKRRKTVFGHGTSRTAGVPLVALIINSRVGKTGRWGLPQSPFKGVSRAAGRAAMQRLAMKLLKGRHSSISFLRSGWIGAIKDLIPYAKLRAGRSPLAGQDADYEFSTRGDAAPAVEGVTAVSAKVENTTGMEGDERKVVANDALHRYGDMVLQSAVDREYAETVKYLAKKYGQDAETFNEMCK